MKRLLILFTLILIASQVFALSDTNLIAYYKFDEASGNLIDYKGYDNNGTNADISYNQAGIINTSYYYNGSSSKSTLASVTSSHKGYTFSFWADNNGDQSHFIFDSRVDLFVLSIKQSAISNNIGFYDGAWKNFGKTATVGTLKQYTFVFNATDSNAILYINGVEQASAAYTGKNLGGTVTIGSDESGTYDYKGRIDEFSLWDRVLSASEVAELYNSGAALAYPFSTPTAKAKVDFNIYRSGTSTHLTNVTADCNVNAMDFTSQNSPVTGIYQDQNTSFSCNFTRTGYDANNSYIGVADSNKTLVIYMTDSTAPVVGAAQIEGFTTYGSYIKGTGTASATYTETGSGLSQCQYSINNGGSWTSSDSNATHCYEELTITDQNYTFKFRATDVAGNTGIGASSSTYIGDASAPTMSITANQVTGTTDQNLTIYCNDTISGCKFIQYRINSGTWNYIPQTYSYTQRDQNEYVDANDPTYTGYNTTSYENYVSHACIHYYSGASDKGTVKYTITYTDATTADSNTFTDNTGGQNLKVCFSGWTTTKAIQSIDLNISTSGGWSTPHINDQNIYQTRNMKGSLSNTYFPFTYSGPGIHDIDYFGGDYIDNNSGTSSLDFNTYGVLHIDTWYEDNATSPFTGDIRFNGTDYNNVTGIDINLQTIIAGTYTIDFTEGITYGPRHYRLDLNLFTDTNINMLMLDTTQGTELEYQVFRPDQLTEFANALVYITKQSDLNYTIGSYLTNADGEMTVFTSIYDQNYLFDINSGEYVYQPVALTVKIPIDEETSAVITNPFRITITGAGAADYNDLVADTIVYLLPNTIAQYKLVIQDVNDDYFTRTYYRSYKGNPLTDTLQPYLIRQTSGLLTTIYTVDGYTQQPYPGVELKIYKDLPSGRTLVEDLLTDDKGSALGLFVIGDTYEYDIYLNGALYRSDTIISTSSTVYIVIGVGPTLPDTNNYFLTTTWIPKRTKLIGADRDLNFTATVTHQGDSNIFITTIRCWVTNTDINGTTLDYNIVNRIFSFGDTTGTVSYDLNQTARTVDGNWYDTNGYLWMTCQVTLSDGNVSLFTHQFAPITNVDYLTNFGDGLKPFFGCTVSNDPLIPCPGMLLAAIFLSLILTVAVAVETSYQSMEAMGIVFVAVMGMFTYLGWVPYGLFLILIALLVIIAVAVGGKRL